MKNQTWHKLLGEAMTIYKSTTTATLSQDRKYYILNKLATLIV